MLTRKPGLLEYILLFGIKEGIFNASEGHVCVNTAVCPKPSPGRLLAADRRYSLPLSPGSPPPLRTSPHLLPLWLHSDTQFFSLSLDDQAPSNSWARTGAILSPWNTLSPVLTRGTLLKRSSHREDVVNHLSDMVPLLLPSWCPVTFLVHILCKHVLTDDYGFNVHLSPLCSRSTRITLHAGGGIHIC